MNSRGQGFAAWYLEMGGVHRDVRIARHRPARGWTEPRHAIVGANPYARITPDGTAVAFDGWETRPGQVS
jgi:hypothetical protein